MYCEALLGSFRTSSRMLLNICAAPVGTDGVGGGAMAVVGASLLSFSVSRVTLRERMTRSGKIASRLTPLVMTSPMAYGFSSSPALPISARDSLLSLADTLPLNERDNSVSGASEIGRAHV